MFYHARRLFLTAKSLLAEANFPDVTTYLPAESRAPLEPEIVGPVLSLDLGSKRVGAAVSHPRLVAITRLGVINRSSWKQLLHDVCDLIRRFDAKTLVIGFPLRLDGSEGSAAIAVRETAQKFALSLTLPVYLQDERLSSTEAQERLRAEGLRGQAITDQLDSESAAIILRDFIEHGQQRTMIERP